MSNCTIQPIKSVFFDARLFIEPAALVRAIARHLQSCATSLDISCHESALRDLWVGLTDEANAPLMDHLKWEESFRHHPYDYLFWAVNDVAALCDTLAKRVPSPITLYISNVKKLDALSEEFARALERRGGLRVIYQTANSNIDDESTVCLRPNERWLATATGLERRQTLMTGVFASEIKDETAYLAQLAEAAQQFCSGGFYDAARYCANLGMNRCQASDLEHPREEYRFLTALYIVGFVTHDEAHVMAIVQQMLTLAKQLDDGLLEANARYYKTMYHLRMHQPPQADIALEEYALALRLVPEDSKYSLLIKAFLHNGQALAHMHLRQIEASREECEHAMRWLEPHLDDPQVRVEYATFLYNVSQLHLSQGQFKEALHWLDRVLAIEGNLSFYIMERGCYLTKAGQHSEALMAFSEARLRGVPTPQLLANLSDLQTDVDPELALETLKEVRLRFPTYLDGYLNASALLIEAEEAETAEAVIQAGLAVVPGSAELWNNLGLCLHAQHRKREAQVAYHTALTHQPSLIDALINLATLAYEEESCEEARNWLQRALQLNPVDQTALANLAFLDNEALSGAS